MKDTMEWRKKTFHPALFPQAMSLGSVFIYGDVGDLWEMLPGFLSCAWESCVSFTKYAALPELSAALLPGLHEGSSAP